MKKALLWVASAALVIASVAACDNKSEKTGNEYEELTLTVAAPSVSGVSFNWASGDAISVFDGKANQKFITSGSGSSAQFTGTAFADASAYMAVYPYDANLARRGGKVTLTVPTSQQAVEGGIAKESIIAAAYATTPATGLNFVMLPAILKLNVVPGANKIISAEIAAKGGESIAGTCEVTLAETPAVAGGNSSKVTLSGALNGNYYVAVLPAALSQGVTVSFTDDSDSRSSVDVSASALSSGAVVDLGTFDRFEFAGARNPNPTGVEQAVIVKASFEEADFNLISDPSFDDFNNLDRGVRTNWRYGHDNVIRVDGHTGKYGWFFDNAIAGWFCDVAVQCFGMRENTDYVYTAWLKGNTPHIYNGVRVHPNGPLAERGGLEPGKMWLEETSPTTWTKVVLEYNTLPGHYYGDVFCGLWGDSAGAAPLIDTGNNAFASIDDVSVVPKGYDKKSMAPVSSYSVAKVTNATYDEVTAFDKVVAWKRSDGNWALAFSNVTINGTVYGTAIATLDESDASKGLTINKFLKTGGIINNVAKPEGDEIAIVPDAVFAKDGKTYLHYYATCPELEGDTNDEIWWTSRSGFYVSEDEGLSWNKVDKTWAGRGKFSQAGFINKDGYVYMIASGPGRTDSFFDNFFAARISDKADFTNPEAYDYWLGTEWNSDATEAAVGPDALLSVGDISEPAVVYNEKFGRYMLIYRSNKHAGIVFRDSDAPEGPWSGEKVITLDEELGKLVSPTVLGVESDGSLILLANKVSQ